MEVSRTENLPPPPGIINSIKAGFETIATHITAILLPLLLNLFLWLGPRLRMDALFDSVKTDVISMWQSGGMSAADIDRIIQSYESTLPKINLFSLIFTAPVGISNLFNSSIRHLLFPRFFDQFLAEPSAQTPLGNPLILQASAWNLLGWVFLLVFIGWVFGGLYFRNVAWLATAAENTQPVLVSRAIVQTVLASISWGIFCMMVGFPIVLVLALLVRINLTIAQLGFFLLSLMSMWVIVPLFFWSYGIFLKQQNFVTSIISSVQMARFALPTSSMFVLTVFLLTIGLNLVWSIPPRDSWVTLLGIFGHSFVSTALLAGSFIYYRDMNIWLQNVIDKLRKTPAIKQA